MARGNLTALICGAAAILAGSASADSPAAAVMGAEVVMPKPSLAFGRADITLTLVRRGARQPDSPIVSDVEIQGEVTSDASAQALGFRSMVAVADVDCGSRRDRVLQFDGYDGGGLTGALRAVVPSDTWETPSGSQAAHVLASVCGTAETTGVARAPAPLEAAAAPSAARPPAQPPARLAPKTGRPAVLQLGSYPTSAGARSRLRQLGALPAGLTGGVAVAQIHGVTHYRAVVSGFADAAAASAFCAERRLPAAGCWIH
jgi:hypothetical protein